MRVAARHHSEEVFALSKWRLKFSKKGMGKYISHLDLLRTFTRAIHRANLPVRYSQGFNPHQLITFSLPLALGVTSETEFVDIDFEETASPREIGEALNKTLPPDIRILRISRPELSANDIVSARYEIDLSTSTTVEKATLEAFFAQENIPALKKTKKGEKEVNLRDFIVECEVSEVCGNKVKLNIVLSAGGSANIKPDIVLGKLALYLGFEEFEEMNIHRTEIFCSSGKEIKNFC